MNETGLVDQEKSPVRKEAPKELVTIARIVYILHGLSIVIGVFSGCTIATAYIFGWPSVVAVILNYAKRKEAEGTFVATHFTWQIRTFWYAVAWVVIVWVFTLADAFILIGLAYPVIGFAVLGVFIVYRIVDGWLKLNDGKPMVN